MTDRHAGYLIALEHDVREDDAEQIMTAIRQIRGVADVAPCLSGSDLALATLRVDHQWRQRIHALITTKENQP